MKALVIYDLTGLAIPEGAQLERIDLTDPKHPEAVFSHLPKTDIGKLQTEIAELKAGHSHFHVLSLYLI